MGLTDSLPNNSWYLLNKMNLNISPKPTLCNIWTVIEGNHFMVRDREKIWVVSLILK